MLMIIPDIQFYLTQLGTYTYQMHHVVIVMLLILILAVASIRMPRSSHPIRELWQQIQFYTEMNSPGEQRLLQQAKHQRELTSMLMPLNFAPGA